MNLLQRILAKVQELRGESSTVSMPDKMSPPTEVERQVFSSTLASLNEWNAKRDRIQGPCRIEWLGSYKRPEVCGRGSLGCRVVHPQVAEETYARKDWDRAAIAIQIASAKDGASATPEDFAKLERRAGRRNVTRGWGRSE